MHHPTVGEGPLLTGDCPCHRCQVVGGPPVVVVEISDVATVGQLTQNGGQGAAETVGIEAAVPLRGGVAEIENGQRHVPRAFGADLIERRPLALGDVDADEEMDASIHYLAKHRPRRLDQRRPDHRGNDHRDIRGTLVRVDRDGHGSTIVTARSRSHRNHPSPRRSPAGRSPRPPKPAAAPAPRRA